MVWDRRQEFGMPLLGREPELKEPALRGHRGVDEHGVAEATVLPHHDA